LLFHARLVALEHGGHRRALSRSSAGTLDSATPFCKNEGRSRGKAHLGHGYERVKLAEVSGKLLDGRDVVLQGRVDGRLATGKDEDDDEKKEGGACAAAW
jgi:hypothetical protein